MFYVIGVFILTNVLLQLSK